MVKNYTGWRNHVLKIPKFKVLLAVDILRFKIRYLLVMNMKLYVLELYYSVCRYKVDGLR